MATARLAVKMKNCRVFLARFLHTLPIPGHLSGAAGEGVRSAHPVGRRACDEESGDPRVSGLRFDPRVRRQFGGVLEEGAGGRCAGRQRQPRRVDGFRERPGGGPERGQLARHRLGAGRRAKGGLSHAARLSGSRRRGGWAAGRVDNRREPFHNRTPQRIIARASAKSRGCRSSAPTSQSTAR